MDATKDVTVKKKKTLATRMWQQKELILIALPFVVYILVFNYAPLMGWLMAFQRYRPGLGLWEQEWVGLENFKMLFSDASFIQVIRNTISMSLINLSLGFFFSIAFAVMLNELKNRHVKKIIQTVSYLPHFLSWIIVTGIVLDVLSTETGVINQLLMALNVIEQPINFLADPKYFWWIVGFSNVWKSTGWGSIIYLSSMSSINEELYEAAEMDGANRLRKIWHITLPGIKPTIFILLLINIGNIMNAGFEVQYLLGNGLVQEVSQTIDIYVLRYGISLGNYSLATAAGIFNSVISVVLITLANKFSKAAGEESLF
ncbi:ABC transporter permease [Trichococcus shcherbakoviae]|jgi:putative aldouronate transport system permease protein|uniref:Sugar ABC transporter permease n=2 Tax=root TaxID=1 RepID=A0A5C5E4Z1_9LACT|nr:ABC transporter permease subunit [Trichococcus shcherbakoviae]TNV68051.1 sugar ABC transporter permease [Trichococcus shcherbakoviae subsp. psychrophilus]